MKEKRKFNKRVDEISSKYRKSGTQDPKVGPKTQDP